MRVQAVRWKIARRHLNHRRSHRLRWALALILSLMLVLSGATGAAGYYWVSQLPSVNRFHVHYTFQNARIFDARGDLLYNMADLSKTGGRRVVEPLQDQYDQGNACRGGVNRIPLLLQDATIATEDATFYKNPGFDALSILRAAYQDLKFGHIVSGASTITQQMVRANILNNQQTLSRKAQEVALAYEVSKKFSKRKILWYYLNSVPYGNSAYGAQAAAGVYFGKQICRLDSAQAALLAGLPRAPTDYNPVFHRSAALARMRTVLHLMRLHGYLHYQWQIDRALREAAGWRFAPAQAQMRYPQFVRYVVGQIQHLPAINARLYQGIDVYTTLDPRLQNLAQHTVTRQIDGLAQQHVTDGALISLDLRPQHYGWILAMVGSAHYQDRTGQINMAITPRQPGSSMKPFNYIWAFQHGKVSPATQVQDSPIMLPDPNDTQHHGWYQPTNYDHQFHGTVTLRQALANSLNVPAVKVEYYITGPNHVAETAYRYGMSSLYRDNPHLACSVCYAVTLGGLSGGTRLLEETAAYGVFASGGVTVPPVAIWKVVQRGTGRVLFCSADCPRGAGPTPWLAGRHQRVLDPAHAYEMTNVLADNNARCSAQLCEFGLTSPLRLSRPAAAKTGTTNVFSDNWTVGYTPQLVTGVWAGNADRTPMIHVIGVTGAAPVWHDYMEGAFKLLRLPVQPFRPPSDVARTGACNRSGATWTNYGVSDLIVAQPGTILTAQDLPMCQLPEKGFLPVPCSKYPANPLPPTFRCPYNSPYTYTYTYTYGSGTTSTSTQFYPPGSVPPPNNGSSQQNNGYPPPNPAPVQPVQPAPVQPQPIQPAPVQPQPIQPPAPPSNITPIQPP